MKIIIERIRSHICLSRISTRFLCFRGQRADGQFYGILSSSRTMSLNELQPPPHVRHGYDSLNGLKAEQNRRRS